MTRPARLAVVTGTGTEVGKTWVGAAVLAAGRRRGLRVAARKPLQSYSPGEHPLDSEVLAAASGEPEELVCPQGWRYAAPMAPPMAAAALGRPVPSLEALAAFVEGSWPGRGCDLALVEGAGGVASPLGADASNADLVQRLAPDAVVLVADASLGVINAVRLSVAALGPRRVIVHLNRYQPADDLHRRNLAWLSEVDRLDVTTDVEQLLGRVVG